MGFGVNCDLNFYGLFCNDFLHRRGDDTDDDSGDGSKCDIDCYKNYIEGAIDCVNDYADCMESGDPEFICNNDLMTCDEVIEGEAKGCTDKCEDSCFGAFIGCIDNYEEEGEEEKEDNYDECIHQCWEQFGERAKWFDYDCWHSCATDFGNCMNSAYEAHDYETMHQCVDDYKTRWLGCISD